MTCWLAFTVSIVSGDWKVSDRIGYSSNHHAIISIFHFRVPTRPHHDDYWPGAELFAVSDAPFRTLYYPEGASLSAGCDADSHRERERFWLSIWRLTWWVNKNEQNKSGHRTMGRAGQFIPILKLYWACAEVRLGVPGHVWEENIKLEVLQPDV